MIHQAISQCQPTTYITNHEKSSNVGIIFLSSASTAQTAFTEKNSITSAK
jgi:hypothetical protein